MKKKTSKLKGFTQFAILFSVLGFYSVAQAVTINAKVNDDETKLEITTPGNCTSGTNNNGCIKANGNTPAVFNLTGNRKCSNGDFWVIDKVAIRKTESGADGSGLETIPDLEDDFNVDLTTGVVDDENGGSGNYQVQNNNKGTYTVWYRVYATCGGDEINSDPRMVNNGTG
jgi:hypothetical protein